jgi:hypothetical protein
MTEEERELQHWKIKLGVYGLGIFIIWGVTVLFILLRIAEK